MMKYWEITADNLSKAGWSLGWVSAVDSEGRTMFVADAHREAIGDLQIILVKLTTCSRSNRNQGDSLWAHSTGG